jgi:hypothetical protein
MPAQGGSRNRKQAEDCSRHHAGASLVEPANTAVVQQQQQCCAHMTSVVNTLCSCQSPSWHVNGNESSHPKACELATAHLLPRTAAPLLKLCCYPL